MKMLYVCMSALLFSLSSCVVKEGILISKWDPVDYHIDRWYPIKDTTSCALEVKELTTGERFCARDRSCRTAGEYSIGDTITLVMIKPRDKSRNKK